MIKNMKINTKNKQAFSLVEILMSILIVSLIFVAMAPVFTKRMLPRKNQGIVYTYNGASNLSVPNSCFIANVDFEDGSYDETYSYSPDCTEYEFQVPDGVNRINLTLVAGGGGGGGAAGGLQQSETLSTGALEESYTKNILSDIIKNVKLLYLTATGKEGTEFSFGPEETCAILPETGSRAPRCAGKGGNSSIAISDLDLPVEYIKGANFQNVLSTASPINTNFEVSNTDNNASLKISWGDGGANRTLTYGINNSGSDYKLFCKLGNSEITSANSNFASICQIPSNNIIQSVEGAYGTFFSSADEVFPVHQVFKGGAGGKNSHPLGNYGSGGDGQSFQLGFCKASKWFTEATSCSFSDMSLLSLGSNIKGKVGNSSIIIETEYPGGTGGGGAAGSAIRIVNFPVVPNQAYKIVVGKGGAGGLGGSASDKPANGINGMGGTSSAIYDKDNNLIFMVNGGAGGEGGKIYDGTAYTGESGLSARNYKMLITSDANLYQTTVLDEKIASGLQSIANNVEFNNENGNKVNFQTRRIQYNQFQNEPYNTLNKRMRNDSNNIVDFTGNVANKTGGFSGFDINSVGVSTSQYDGLYYRSLIKGSGAYIGGLGGFSGFGNKAGCGGYFMGNFDGRQNGEGTLPSDEAKRQDILNSFVVDNKTYKVSDYYENCSTISPNGTKAEFVAPSPNSSNYGSAGSGGGGGGYNINAGSGNGGDGQDGYVMIEWRK